jgi:hypothetical protein
MKSNVMPLNVSRRKAIMLIAGMSAASPLIHSQADNPVIQKTCKFCKFWKQENSATPNGFAHYGECSCPKLSLGWNKVWKGREFSTMDGMWQAGGCTMGEEPLTGINFGCVQWQEKSD